MPRSARVQQVEEIIETLTPAEQSELARDLVRREHQRAKLAGLKALVDELDAKLGPVPSDELARVDREWPPG